MTVFDTDFIRRPAHSYDRVLRPLVSAQACSAPSNSRVVPRPGGCRVPKVRKARVPLPKVYRTRVGAAPICRSPDNRRATADTAAIYVDPMAEEQ